MMAGLVAMRVLADQPGDVGRGVFGQSGRNCEELVELFHKWRAPSPHGHIALHVVLDAEGRLPCVGFGVISKLIAMAQIDGIEWLSPFAIAHLGPDEPSSRIEEVSIVRWALALNIGIFMS